jgi:triacylglycerol lipase
MPTKYPIILAHGIVLKDVKFFKAFGHSEKLLRENDYATYTAPTDGFGSIENNAAQLRDFIREIMAAEGVSKVNIIAHSKGGLDSRYMIDHLGMAEHIASLTFLSTPHKGSKLATNLYRLPRVIKHPIACYLHTAYRMFGDKHPEVFKVCEQLQYAPEGALETLHLTLPDATYEDIFMQSYSSTMAKSSDDFVMGIPLAFSRYFEKGAPTDGMVSAESSQYAIYRGDCLDGSVSHSEIVDFMVKKSKKEKIYAFYLELCEDLARRGY